jgi:hypothetical protein
VIVVVVAKETVSSVRQTGGDRHAPAGAAPPAHGSTSTHAARPDHGDAGTPDSGSGGDDTSKESDQGHDASHDGGHDQGDDGSDAGAAVGGDGEDHHGDSTSGDDGHSASDQGDASDD